MLELVGLLDTDGSELSSVQRTARDCVGFAAKSERHKCPLMGRNVTRRFRSTGHIFAALKQTPIQLSSSLAGHSRSQGLVSWTTKLGAAFTRTHRSLYESIQPGELSEQVSEAGHERCLASVFSSLSSQCR